MVFLRLSCVIYCNSKKQSWLPEMEAEDECTQVEAALVKWIETVWSCYAPLPMRNKEKSTTKYPLTVINLTQTDVVTVRGFYFTTIKY